MKRIIKIIIWMLISFMIQSSVLLYFSSYYRSSKSMNYKWNSIPNKKKSNIKVSIPDGAKNINISSTGKFASYYLENSIHVVEMNTNKDNTMELDVPASDTSISWRASDDKLMVIEKKHSEIKVYTYDPKENKLTRDFDMNNEARSYMVGNNYKITGIQQNDINTLIYLKVTKNNSQNYSFLKALDISNDIKPMNLPIHNIGNYCVFKAENTVVFEDEVDKKIYMASNKAGTDEWPTEPLRIPGVTGLKLLGVDDKGMVYVGKLINNKISTIYTCNISTGTAGNNYTKKTETFMGKWNRVLLKEQVESTKVYISDVGDIYTIDDTNEKVLNVKTGKETSFSGSYICMFGDSMSGGIISLKGNKLIETII